MNNLGKAVGILVRAYMNEYMLHESVYSMNGHWSAPAECHDVIERGRAKRLRQARRHALAVSGYKNMRLLRRAVRRSMGGDAPIYRRYGMVPY